RAAGVRAAEPARAARRVEPHRARSAGHGVRRYRRGARPVRVPRPAALRRRRRAVSVRLALPLRTWQLGVAALLGVALLLAGPLLLVEMLARNGERIYGLEPGPRSAAHRDIVDCAACHASQRTIVESRCLACHEAIAARIKTQRGLHGLAHADGLTCARC